MSKVRLHIPEPCHEDWSLMSATEKGKFCVSCNKEVFDFTALNRKDFQKTFRQFYDAQADVCGQFRNDQLVNVAGSVVRPPFVVRTKLYLYSAIGLLLPGVFSACKISKKTSGPPIYERQPAFGDHLRPFNQFCDNSGRTAGSIVIKGDTIRPDTASINKLLFARVHFDNDVFALSTKAQAILDAFIEGLRKTRYESIEIIGHTDSIGGMQYNKVLSEKRAQAVQLYLENAGLKAGISRGVGYQYPVSSNVSMAGRADNRRVEIRVKTRDQKK